MIKNNECFLGVTQQKKKKTLNSKEHTRMLRGKLNSK